MLQNCILKIRVTIVLLLLINIAAVGQGIKQEDGDSKVMTFEVTEYSYEEFQEMLKAGLIHPVDEEYDKIELKIKETGETPNDSIKSIEDDLEWMDLDLSDITDVDFDNNEEVDDIFLVVETQPEYPGGLSALRSFVKENLKYPQICRENNIQGRVIVSFIVDKDGSVVEPVVVNSVHPALDAEALRLVSIMPKWTPGMQRGKPVRVKYTVPLTFSLGDGLNFVFSADQTNQFGGLIVGDNIVVLSRQHVGSMSTPKIVKDPSDKTNNCFVVKAGRNKDNQYDVQLFIISNSLFAEGDIVTLTMKVKAEKPQTSDTEAHSVPGNFIYESPCDVVDFTTDWTEYSSTFSVTSDLVRTIAVDLATLKSGNKCYFDDIRLTVKKGEKKSNATLANGATNKPAPQKSAFDLGMDYLLGSGDHTQDFQKAYSCFSAAADEGNADAICMMGYMYEKGYAVTQDYNTAIDWYKKAAQKDHAGAQNSLGRMYANGYGVEKDKEQALSWYRKAAANGNNQAKNSIAQLEKETGSKTIALIIGNADYPQGRLANPVNDAQDLAVKLKGLGFDVIGKTNLDLADMNKAIDDFCKKASDYDAAMFFYAGHAVQNQGVNYLMPAKSTVDAAAINDACVNMNQFMAKLDASDVKTKIIILDACRDNGLQSLSRSASEQGLARMSSSGSIIMFSTQAGKTAKDGTGNRNSPFTQELLKEIDKPNVPLHQMFKDIQTNVSNNTNKEQVPSINDDLIGTFYFNVKY